MYIPLASLLLAILPTLTSAQSASISALTGADLINIPAPSTAPTPPPCSIMTQICTFNSAPFWTPPAFNPNDPPPSINFPNCSVSYTNQAGALSNPQLTGITGGKNTTVPCGEATDMEFETDFGQIEVKYNETLGGGIPADPFISVGHHTWDYDAWRSSNCFSGEYEGQQGVCYYWWCTISCNTVPPIT